MNRNVGIAIGIAVAAVIGGTIFGLTMLPTEDMEEADVDLETEMEPAPVGKNLSITLTETVGVEGNP